MAKKGVNYLYGIDFTDKKAILETYKEGDTAATEELVAILTEKTQDPWVRQETEGYSVLDAVVEYNGANDRTSRPTISSFKNIMIIALGECSTEVLGRIYIHYN